jgi:uncharacterized protein with HEPN domain
MARHKPEFYLMHMLDHARYASRAAADRQRSDLDADPMFRAASERWISVIGEAAARLPEDIRVGESDIEWRKIIGMRHHLVHGYDVIDYDVVWEVISAHLPVLIGRLEAMLRERNIDPDTLLSGDNPKYSWDQEED